jgi:hypothetical protein
MQEAINAAIAMLESAKLLPAEQAKTALTEVARLLVGAVKKVEAPDSDPGPGNSPRTGG